jgi:hypothetical protein
MIEVVGTRGGGNVTHGGPGPFTRSTSGRFAHLGLKIPLTAAQAPPLVPPLPSRKGSSSSTWTISEERTSAGGSVDVGASSIPGAMEDERRPLRRHRVVQLPQTPVSPSSTPSSPFTTISRSVSRAVNLLTLFRIVACCEGRALRAEQRWDAQAWERDLEPGKEGKGGFHTSTVSINVPFQLFPSQPFYHASIIKEAQMIKCSVLSDTAALEVIHSRSQFIHIRPISKR